MSSPNTTIPPHLRHFSAFFDKSSNVIDKWILSRLSEVTKEYKQKFDNYDPINARRVLEDFFWHEFCDYYIEMIKYRLYGQNKKDKSEAEGTLYTSLLTILQLWSPFIPHITEELYQELFEKTERIKSIHISQLPKETKIDKKSISCGNLAVTIIGEIRKWKSEKNMSMGAEVDKLVLWYDNINSIKNIKNEIMSTMRIKDLEFKKGALKIL